LMKKKAMTTMCIIIRTHINSFVPLHQIWIKTAAGRNYQRYPDVLFLFLEFPFFWGGDSISFARYYSQAKIRRELANV
jgi:hypothetical protein